jgi:hypothetical protein
MDPHDPADPTIRAYIRRVQAIAGIAHPTGADEVFEDARQWLDGTAPTARLRLLMERDNGPASHFNVLKGGAWPYGNVHSALRRTHYHRDNFARMEREIIECVRETGIAALLGGQRGTIGGGDTCALDAEYQAFIVSARACLDYLTYAIAAYFGQRSHSFHGLPEAMKRWKPAAAVAGLRAELDGRHAALAHFFSQGADKSVRDRIVHREFVRAGCLNVNATGVFLAGSSEPDESSGDSSQGVRLLPSLDAHLGRIEEIVIALFRGLMAIDREAP